MNSHLTYLVAHERTNDLIRDAKQARLAKNDREVASTTRQRGRTGRVLARLRIFVPRRQRLSAGPSAR
jgi:hypothetical protein